jgi:hypothetical protein
MELVPPKDAIASIAREVQKLDGRPLSLQSISAAIRADELQEEIVNVLMDIDAVLV